MKVTINEKQFHAIMSMVDLAANAVSDAEFEHCEYKKVKRRNGGYSACLKISEKWISQTFKAFKKAGKIE